MRIHCTKKLLEVLKKSPEIASEEEDALFSWHANLITIGRKKAVVAMNNKNRYAVVLYGLKAKDFKEMDKLIPEAVRTVFKSEYIKEEVIEKYLQHSANLSFDKTKDRKMVARLNRACEDFYFAEEMLDGNNLIQIQASKWLNDILVGNGKSSYLIPREEMYKDLEEFAGQSIFHSEAVQLKVSLTLKNQSVWRRLTVPQNFTFPDLHKVLQTAFGWQNRHLHEFVIYGEGKDSATPVLRLVCLEEALAYESPIPMKMETEHKLSDHLSDTAGIIYNYDFGDNWIHRIEVERLIEDYPVNYSICEDGEGNAPPEDVGGEAGYQEFLRILQDPSDPEHDQMVEWSKMQDYKEFNFRDINGKLKRGR